MPGEHGPLYQLIRLHMGSQRLNKKVLSMYGCVLVPLDICYNY